MTFRALNLLTLLSVFAGFGFVAVRPTTDVQTQARSSNPVIAEYGKVVCLPDAAQQPRDGSRIVVDVTRGDDPDKLNSALEKVCRFVNIYAGAGRKKSRVDIVVVIHGSATLSVLNSAAYQARYQVSENPSLKVIKRLRKAGVRMYVCGQSLLSKGATRTDVSKDVQVAVSALTTLVNLQSDGYGFVPLSQ